MTTSTIRRLVRYVAAFNTAKKSGGETFIGIQLQGSADDHMTILVTTQDHHSYVRESHKPAASGSGGEISKEGYKDRERHVQIEILRNILEFQTISSENQLQTRIKAIEQQLQRIEGLERERRELQEKCDEYDRRHEEIHKYAHLRKKIEGGAERSQNDSDKLSRSEVNVGAEATG